MSRDAIRPGTAGFALAEALISLLLLAVALLGAGTAVVEALSAQHAALLQTRAADLASDLAEALRRGATPGTAESELASWQEEVRRQLPVAMAQALPLDRSASPAFLPADLGIHLRWQTGRDAAAAELHLPVALGSVEGSP